MFSYTRPRDNIVRYHPWYIRKGDAWRETGLVEGHAHGKGVVARLAGCGDRDQAQALIGSEIGIRRSQLPDTGPGEYYWRDLEGLRVVNLDGEDLGVVDSLLETGANDVLVVKDERERLIPFIRDQVIVQVDLDAGLIRVDWDSDF